MTKDEKRLIDAGWWKTDQGLWLRKGLNSKWGGYPLKSALENQDQQDIIAKYGAYYYFTKDQMGFGYWIGVYDGPTETPRRTHFDHLEREVAEKVVNALNAGKPAPPIGLLKRDYRQILIFEEKHGNRYFIVNNRPELEQVALKIVLERNEQGWYCFNDEAVEPNKPKIPLSEAASYGNLEKAIKEEWESYENQLKWYKKNKLLAETLDTILTKKDAPLALRFIKELQGAEYEGWELVTPEEIA